MIGCDDIDVGESVYGIFGRYGAGDDLSDSQAELLLGRPSRRPPAWTATPEQIGHMALLADGHGCAVL